MTDRRPNRSPDAGLTRRSLLRAGGAALASMPFGSDLLRATIASAATVRRPDSLPDPARPAGTATAALPFDHIVVVMMENHSFDNLLGALARSGQLHADGLRFNTAGVALDSNPGPNG